MAFFADQMRAFADQLDTCAQERDRALAGLSEELKAKRHEFCNQHKLMQKQLHETLTRARSNCQQEVGDLVAGCREAREELSSDLRQAGQIWRSRKRQ